MKKQNMLCFLVVIVLSSMLAMAIAGKSRFPIINGIVSAIVLPVEAGLTVLGHGADNTRDYWRALTVLGEENKQLKQENIELRNSNIRMGSLYAENLQLRQLLDYKEKNPHQKLVTADVIARHFGDQKDIMYISVGADKGIKENMAVVNGGLVGIVDKVYGSYARVLLVTSPDCRISSRVLRISSRAVGLAEGLGEANGTILMGRIARDASVNEGDVIVTTGYSGSHPADILIGHVTKISKDTAGLLQEAQVKPAADVANVEHVMVITEYTPAPPKELYSGEHGGTGK